MLLRHKVHKMPKIQHATLTTPIRSKYTRWGNSIRTSQLTWWGEIGQHWTFHLVPFTQHPNTGRSCVDYFLRLMCLMCDFECALVPGFFTASFPQLSCSSLQLFYLFILQWTLFMYVDILTPTYMEPSSLNPRLKDKKPVPPISQVDLDTRFYVHRLWLCRIFFLPFFVYCGTICVRVCHMFTEVQFYRIIVINSVFKEVYILMQNFKHVFFNHIGRIFRMENLFYPAIPHFKQWKCLQCILMQLHFLRISSCPCQKIFNFVGKLIHFLNTL